MSDNYGQWPMNQPLYTPHEMTMRDPGNSDNKAEIQNIGRKYMNYHVIAQLKDGSRQEGIIDGIRNDGIVILVPEDIEEDQRQFTGQRPRFRRFRRFLFPFSLFAFPFLFPFPHHR